MMRYIVMAAVGIAVAAACPALAANADKSAPAAQSPADGQKPKERKICERVIETGSIAPKRICRTVAEKQADESQAQSTLDDMRRGVAAGGGALGNR